MYRRLIDEEGFRRLGRRPGVGLHFVGTELVEVLSDRPRTGYRVEPGSETRLEPRVLG